MVEKFKKKGNLNEKDLNIMKSQNIKYSELLSNIFKL